MDLRFSAAENNFRDEAKEWLLANKPKEARPTDGEPMRAFDLDWQRRQYDGGWAGLAWPREHGGRGASLIEQLIWYEECARANAPLQGCLTVALNHGGPTLIARGSEAQKAIHLPQILRGEVVWCQGFSEPGSGSDLASLRTRAEIDGDDLVVNGQKVWTSHAHLARWQELLVRTDPSVAKHRGLTWVICDMTTPGITVRPIRTLAGHHHFCEVFYDNVRIPLANVVGAVNDGWRVAMSTLSFERGTGYVAKQLDLARAIEELISLARELPGPNGSALLNDDEVAGDLAELKAEVAALRSMTYAQISRCQREAVPGPEGAIVALYYGELSQRVHRMAMRILGPHGLMRGGASEDLVGAFLHVFHETIAGGTSEIRRNIIGERVLGLPRVGAG